MLLSQFFLPILKENPKEAQIPSHQLMLRAGLIHKLGSGLYNWLPLGLRVLRKIEAVIHQEMEAIGASSLLMSTIQPATLWQESGRYEDYGKEMLRVKDRHDTPLLYGPTNEEVITDIFRHYIKSYKSLPLNLYQIQWKFRDEIRPRFGVMRGREFLMKDGYSFDLDKESSTQTYNQTYQAYLRIFKNLGLRAIAVRADNGAIGGNLSHEFHILAGTGESDIYYDKKLEELIHSGSEDLDAMQQLYAAADEKHNPQDCPVDDKDLRHCKGIEVGHIFHFGDKYTKAMNASVSNQEGKDIYPQMGSYGIGVSRLIGAIIEASHDEHGIIWPKEVAPFDVGLINLKPGDPTCTNICDQIYKEAKEKNLDVLYDDREESAGKKFATMDLIGLPHQITIGPRGAKEGKAEVKCRKTGNKQERTIDQALP